MLSVSDLADLINEAIAATDKDGNPIETTAEMMAYAQAVIDTLQAGIVAHAPGTVSAIAPPVPGPITNGEATNGLMTLMPAVWTAALMAGFPTAMPAKLSSEASASTGYLMSSGKVNFASGNINGASTATPLSPGTLVAGLGTGGTIDDIEGDPWAADVTGSQGIDNTDLAKAIYGAISSYIKDNAEAAYAPGTVNGTFAPGGGPLIAGFGAGGTIS
jgi:hypothetical protein